MAFQILKMDKVFYVNGQINRETSRSFIIQIEHKIERHKKVVININNVNEIDKEGLKAIKTLIGIALKKGKVFSVVGIGCKDVYDHINQTKIA